jgi:hypothetical protein
MTFLPSSYRTGALVSAIASLLLLLLALFSLARNCLKTNALRKSL